MNTLVVTGTDTGIGKTVVSAGLTAALGATYWKPVQAGLDDETDSAFVARLSGQLVLPEAYRLKLPASPHISAAADGIEIDSARLFLPKTQTPLIVEGAGGVLVPLNRQMLYLDMFARWQAPVVLCARTALGTINHSLLSLRALRGAGVVVAGVIFVGDAEPEVEDTICSFGAATHLGRLRILPDLTAAALRDAVADNLELDVIRQAMGASTCES
ncbi:ATP-dependent dethiobiotin synthetase BioD [Epibacterium sp. SM1969]|uniref:ATP-dependent dethiobiotin synthetase BioD n=1 Tax=Tritonibacter aquimaris TaxID=2663379 RepID=A0A844AZB5_9RHOB|nr:dethiobiotin synthase [Tritonibacter aquimaris]MQY43654.1 ATP-dependent dethiobiotin synthetase BioD [Tritonibacter aquimaris]